MSEFERYIRDRGVPAAIAEHALQYVVAELTDFAPPEALLEELERASGDPEGVRRELDRIEADGSLLSAIELAVLHAAYDDEDARPVVRQAVEDVQTKLPVIDIAIAAIVAMYGMYLYTTKGVRGSRERYDEHGNLRERTIDYFGPSAPLAAVAKLFPFGSRADGEQT